LGGDVIREVEEEDDADEETMEARDEEDGG
jgi:hypothetical protein